MNNKDIFKKVMDNVHAPEELKAETFQRITQKKKNNNVIFMKFLSACAFIVFGVGVKYISNKNLTNFSKTESEAKNSELGLPRFENMQELKSVLAKNSRIYNSTYTEGMNVDIAEDTAVTPNATNAEKETATESNNYSKTNVQVEDVDEADIIKTDGKYIYMVKANMVFIIEANSLKIVDKLDFDDDDNDFIPKEIFIKDNNLVVVGTSYIFDEKDGNNSNKRNNNEDYEEDDEYARDYVYYTLGRSVTQAIVMDISNKEKAKEIRRVSLDGFYSNARMIDNNVYLISNKSVYYYEKMKDYDILPFYIDTAKSNERNIIQAEDIAYFGGTENRSYMMVAGFDITSQDNATVETIFGASNTVYASSKNLYIVQEKYSTNNTTRSTIYKFNLDAGKIKLQAEGTVKGYLDDQFSMDEYEGNLRVATTLNVGGVTKNQLYVLDENLEKIGYIKNMAIDEKIYSVRFIGKVGYIVTFKQIDPLFVIDLSDPQNPQIKGELKIPGYSAYLHPYDDTHIIGIGYNTETTDYGATRNANMKMSMFDVSDLENPKEIFSIDIGDEYAYSEITYNHQALFYNKNMNLIGFPTTYNSKEYKDSKSGFSIFKIDLNKGFEKYGEILDKTDYSNSPQRVIYIEDTLYTIFEDNIQSYNLNTLEKINEIELK
ncbi:MAG: beta-propeller domain-containing protein [Bacilli bacterium]|nr:beta-propeller domain-containing protein [Bacilli bacterium]